ncbi:hypothetical protein Ahy_B09g098307 isoform A [Arachis hypogaea]|uniref:Uncharacterized protein n=1 Tax=Arachis hypogaea TaxID=3818 RepID=A0A444XR24_ARAHY|nr:hypothetical protein Ahy_B09g098307 isoform A [Arachis hypogaea]
MQLRSGRIIHMADKVLNVNGGSATNDSAPVNVQPSDVISRSEWVVVNEINSFIPPIRFGGTSGVKNVQNPQQQSEYSRDYNVGSTSNASNSVAAFRQYVEESHRDLVNLLTQKMTTILNPMMADHEPKFDHLAREVERIARIVDYDEGERQDARGNNKGFENLFQNENDIFRNRKNPQLISRGQNIDDVLARLHANQVAHLAERVCQVEILKKEKEKYKNKRRLKSKPFSRNEKVSYVAMESSNEQFDLDAKVNLSELRKGSPYVCSLLKKIPNNEKSNDSKMKSGKRYSFDISNSDQIFNVSLKNKQLILPEGRTLLSVKDLKKILLDLIQEAIMEGQLKFDDGKKEMKVDSDHFYSEANFAELYFGVNMFGMSYDFDVALGDFE